MTERLQLYLRMFDEHSTTPDVLYTDVVWPGILANQVLDLNPYLAKESADILPSATRNNTVDGKLVAMQFNVEVGLLYYRKDLLEKYGYHHPPDTWDELTAMAKRIQDGERASGKPDFWGFVWQGAPYEGLTCNALEWQVSYGGGRIIEDDGTISVNNPKAALAIEKARAWIGFISPPAVLQFKESDSRNVWDAGNAAFKRDWVWRGRRDRELQEFGGKFQAATALLPTGGAGHASVLGGQSLAISKYSQHPKEAAEFIRYMTSRGTQIDLWNKGAMLSARSDFYDDPKTFASRPDLLPLKSLFTGSAITRPSTVAGKQYDQVSREYFAAVHAILEGKIGAKQGLAALAAKLAADTGSKMTDVQKSPKPVGARN